MFPQISDTSNVATKLGFCSGFCLGVFPLGDVAMILLVYFSKIIVLAVERFQRKVPQSDFLEKYVGPDPP